MISKDKNLVNGLRNSVKELHHELDRATLIDNFPHIIFISGASGAGKTHLTKTFQNVLNSEKVRFAYFDSLGVPSSEEMIEKFGSGENWQKARTIEWVKILAGQNESKLAVLEGSFNPYFALEAAKLVGLKSFVLLAVHCDRLLREERLRTQRNQPELVNDDMHNWAEFIRDKTVELGGKVVDTGDGKTDRHIFEIVKVALDLINKSISA